MEKITAFELFAAMAPNPSDAHIELQYKLDKMKNPHNESHKPKLRDSIEIIADYKIEFAKLMINKSYGK